jgi:hypothetical protein
MVLIDPGPARARTGHFLANAKWQDVKNLGFYQIKCVYIENIILNLHDNYYKNHVLHPGN